MPHSTRFSQPPHMQKAATTETATTEDPPSDGPPEQMRDEPAGARTGDATGDPIADAPDEPAADAPAPTAWRPRHPAGARALTTLAAVLVLAALLLPNQLTRLTPGEFLRIPVEGIFGAALLLLLPPRARRVAAVVAGVGLGLRALLNCLDMGFYSVLARPFDPVLDWGLFEDAVSFLKDSIGQAGATGAVIGVVALVLALLALMTLAVVRLTRVLVRHSAVATRTTLVLGTVWITCAALGVQLAGCPGRVHEHGRPRPGQRPAAAREPGRPAGVRQGGARRRLPRHPARPAADRTARQGRPLHLHRELRPQRDR